MQNFLRRWRLETIDPFVLFILLLAGLKFTHGITGVLDISLYDESSYLHAGTSLAQNGLPAAAYAPLYALWYHVLSLFQPDPVALYYLNYVLTTILPPLFLYLFLRVNRVPIISSALVAAYFLITQANFVTWPRVTHLALMIVLVCGIVISFTRSLDSALAVAALGALLASYVRPEYFLAALMMLVLGAIRLATGRQQGNRLAAALPLVGTILLMLAGVGIFGLPAFDKGGGERHFFAFSQHFALNWARWNHVSADSSYQPGTNFQEIVGKYFGDATTVSSALRHNPGMFAKHVLTNVTLAASRFAGLFFHHENLFLPVGTAFDNIEARFTVLLAVGGLYFCRRSWLPGLRPNLRRHQSLLVCLGLICVPPFIALAEIYPHDHYMLLPGSLLIAGTVILLFGRDELPPAPEPSPLFIGALTMLAVVPMISHRPAVDTPIVRTIRFISSLGIDKPVTELDAEGGYHNYQNANYHQVTEFSKAVGFNRFRSENGINMIILTRRLKNDSHLLNDPEWKAFLDNYAASGFAVRAIPGTENTLLVEQGLLPASAGL